MLGSGCEQKTLEKMERGGARMRKKEVLRSCLKYQNIRPPKPQNQCPTCPCFVSRVSALKDKGKGKCSKNGV